VDLFNQTCRHEPAGYLQEEVVLRAILLWFPGIAIPVIIRPYLFHVVYQ
jgi:hypothetical protein